jgi:membrane associated rhomboid family serine protease
MSSATVRPSRSRDTRSSALSVSAWIVIVNVAVFIAMVYLFPAKELPLESPGADSTGVSTSLTYMKPSPITSSLLFSFTTAVQHFEIWRFFTFQFVHANLAHIAGNMIALMSLGPVVEEYLGRRRFLAFYLMCGATGPIGFLVLIATGGAYSASSTLVGASAGVFGVLAGAAIVAPKEYVELIFPPTPVRLRTMAIIMLGVAAYTVFFHGQTPGLNAGGEAAHLSGALMGLYLIKRPDALDWAETWGPAPRTHR